MTERPPFRLGLAGAGRMGRTHMRALAGGAAVRITAVAEPSEDVRAGLGETGCRLHADLDGMMAADDVDGVLVAMPSDCHLEAVTRIASAGLPILCEKPCGVTAIEAQAAADVARAKGVPLQVAYWRRFVPALNDLKSGIDAGSLGALYFTACYQWDETPPPAAFRRRSGGIYIDMGVHEFDQIRWLSGQEITTVRSVAARVGLEPPVPGDTESAAALCELSGGGTALVSLGRRHAPGDICRVEAFGTAGVAERRFLDPTNGDAVFMDALRRQAEAFAAWVRGGPAMGATAEDAVQALRAAERAAVGS